MHDQVLKRQLDMQEQEWFLSTMQAALEQIPKENTKLAAFAKGIIRGAESEMGQAHTPRK